MRRRSPATLFLIESSIEHLLATAMSCGQRRPPGTATATLSARSTGCSCCQAEHAVVAIRRLGDLSFDP